MAQRNQNWDKVLELIFNHSSKSFRVREISKRTGVPSSTVQRYLEVLRKEKMISEENRPIISNYFKFKKAIFLMDKMYGVGIIGYLVEELNPEVIIVFGSVRKGEYEQDSDIDIFVETSIKKELKLKRFEEKMGRKIQLFVESDLGKLQPNLFNNVINGIKLYGSVKLK